MKRPFNVLRCVTRMYLAALVGGFGCLTTQAAIEVIGVQYQQDQLYPEYKCIWHYDCHADVAGGNVHVYVKNTGASSVNITDVTLAGYSLKTVLKRDAAVHDANSIFFYWDNPPADIMAAGDPAWYKGDPTLIPAGGVAQAVVRLRAVPTTPSVSVGVVTNNVGTVTANVPIDANAAQLASVGFSQDRTKVYLHWRRAGGAAPITVKLDGVDVTANTTSVGDPSMNFGASVINLAAPLTYMSYHVFQGVYADGKTATASLRAWSHPFLYASWGTFPGADQSVPEAQAWIDQATQHGFNSAQNQGIGGSLGSYLNTPEGKAYADARGGYGVVVWNSFQSADPLMCFLQDEPDAEEANMENTFCGDGLKLPCGKSPMGIMALREIEEGETYRAQFPLAPTTVNMDGAFRPVNYITWGQVCDVEQVDPYYQKRLVDAYWWDATQIPIFLKATYIYAVTKATVTGAEPNPAHPILYSCEWRDDVNGVTKTWPFPTPQSKRIEVYYSLAAGAKGLSYWWFKPGYPSNGLGDQSKPAAQTLWKEMGMFGNEIKTISHLLVTSHPVDLPLGPSANVWARALAVGTDTFILFVVNDDYYNDEAGFHSTDVPNATVTATLPSWMQTQLTAFEVTAGGIRSVNTQRTGNQLLLNLGTLTLTRMIVLTKDPQLLSTLQQRYDEQVRPGICAIAPTSCTNTPLSIAQPPPNQIAATGDPARFTIVAFGTNLRYQWQSNSVNLANGPHYSGCTNATLTISNCGPADATSYRCVLTSATGGSNSSSATLTVSTDPPAAPTALAANGIIVNAFTANWTTVAGATGYRLDVSTNNSFSNFVSGFQDLDVGNVASRSVTGLSEAATYFYRVRAWNGNGASANSGTITATTGLTAPAPPTATAATTVGSTSFTANWNSAAAAEGYLLDVSTTNSFASYVSGFQNLDVGNVLSWSVTGLTEGRSHYYRVRAYNGGGPSTNSATISMTTLPAAPVATAASSVVSSGFIANWNSVTGATGYRLDVSTNNAFGNFVIGYQDLDVGSALSRGLIELNAGTTHYYRVRAYNGGGAGASSTTITVILPATTSNACAVTLNPAFEQTFLLAGGGYIATNWTEWETYPGVTVGYDETGIVRSGGHSQRLRVGGTNATSGGIYQRIPVTAGQAYSFSVWTYAGDALVACSLGVHPAGDTNAASGVTWTSANSSQTWVQKTWAGVATSNYLTIFYKVATPDNVKRNGYFDDAGPGSSPLQLAVQAGASGVTLTWPECPGARLEKSIALTTPLTWTTVTNGITAGNGQKSLTISPTESAGFFRLVQE
jgi:hypothetical protein